MFYMWGLNKLSGVKYKKYESIKYAKYRFYNGLLP